MAKPFIKWAGGKGQLLGQLGHLFPRQYETYHEPFLGGGAVFFHLAPANAYLSDCNEDLVNAFLVVRDQCEDLIRSLARHSNERDYYYRIRGLQPEDLQPVERASRFIYLNKTCYNGLYRVNKKGQFNVPFGRYKNPCYDDRDTLVEASRLLSRARAIEAGDFACVLDQANPGDFVYFDPPYQPISDTSKFTSYTVGSFDESEQERLAQVYRELDRRGCRVMLSNSDSDLILHLYSGYRIERVKAKRAVNCDKSKRGEITELVILNYD